MIHVGFLAPCYKVTRLYKMHVHVGIAEPPNVLICILINCDHIAYDCSVLVFVCRAWMYM
jgi:hypothetical protein